MQSPNTLTIRELPKTKKMAVDELHPIMKMQKNVPPLAFSALLSTNKRD